MEQSSLHDAKDPRGGRGIGPEPPPAEAAGPEESVEEYRLYYPLVSEWAHPDGVRFDFPRD
ncbi:MAG: hypothetical protein HYR64_06295 [Fimbriimonas ginsengisoli]|uniref:Uncharacterized protein n=1 Tax=Fimbriimonas ginsengisoli TaxID=1005039 RepID=A0A931PUM2_FIMGI|nr:hypothetical protein [Fimbriimonas ginsengisoli]